MKTNNNQNMIIAKSINYNGLVDLLCNSEKINTLSMSFINQNNYKKEIDSEIVLISDKELLPEKNNNVIFMNSDENKINNKNISLFNKEKVIIKVKDNINNLIKQSENRLFFLNSINEYIDDFYKYYFFDITNFSLLFEILLIKNNIKPNYEKNITKYQSLLEITFGDNFEEMLKNNFDSEININLIEFFRKSVLINKKDKSNLITDEEYKDSKKIVEKIRSIYEIYNIYKRTEVGNEIDVLRTKENIKKQIFHYNLENQCEPLLNFILNGSFVHDEKEYEYKIKENEFHNNKLNLKNLKMESLKIKNKSHLIKNNKQKKLNKIHQNPLFNIINKEIGINVFQNDNEVYIAISDLINNKKKFNEFIKTKNITNAKLKLLKIFLLNLTNELNYSFLLKENKDLSLIKAVILPSNMLNFNKIKNYLESKNISIYIYESQDKGNRKQELINKNNLILELDKIYNEYSFNY